ncbi:MAG TPA: DoxX family protein [Micromonosporaceae bacterium]|nr:DoxX family protein [Micromonosporaceae bacterium]
MTTGMNIGLLLLRVGLAGLLAGHACQKLFGWFRGLGPTGHGAVFDKWGFRPGREMAVLAGVCELVGAGSLAFGFLTPGGCAVVIGTMIVAATPNSSNGLWAHLGGSEVPVVYAGLGVVVALTGPGRFSLDRAFGFSALTDVGWSIAAIVVGLLATIPPLARRRAALRRTATPA